MQIHGMSLSKTVRVKKPVVVKTVIISGPKSPREQNQDEILTPISRWIGDEMAENLGGTCARKINAQSLQLRFQKNSPEFEDDEQSEHDKYECERVGSDEARRVEDRSDNVAETILTEKGTAKKISLKRMSNSSISKPAKAVGDPNNGAKTIDSSATAKRNRWEKEYDDLFEYVEPPNDNKIESFKQSGNNERATHQTEVPTQKEMGKVEKYGGKNIVKKRVTDLCGGDFNPGEGTSKSAVKTSCGIDTRRNEMATNGKNAVKSILKTKNDIRSGKNTSSNKGPTKLSNNLPKTRTPTTSSNSFKQSCEQDEFVDEDNDESPGCDEKERLLDEITNYINSIKEKIKVFEALVKSEKQKIQKIPYVQPLVNLRSIPEKGHVELVKGITLKRSAMFEACAAPDMRKRLNILMNSFWTVDEMRKLVISESRATRLRGQKKIKNSTIKGLIDTCFALQKTKKIPCGEFTSYEIGRQFIGAKLKSHRYNKKMRQPKKQHSMTNSQGITEAENGEEHVSGGDTEETPSD